MHPAVALPDPRRTRTTLQLNRNKSQLARSYPDLDRLAAVFLFALIVLPTAPPPARECHELDAAGSRR
jgi:hypothetical protein